jgi:hypothetical protein
LRVEEEAMQETNMKQVASRAGFLFGLYFDPEYGGDMFFPNVSFFSKTTRCYIPENKILHNHCCGKFIFYKFIKCLLAYSYSLPPQLFFFFLFSLFFLFFLSGGLINRSPDFTLGRVVTEINSYLLATGEVDKDFLAI